MLEKEAKIQANHSEIMQSHPLGAKFQYPRNVLAAEETPRTGPSPMCLSPVTSTWNQKSGKLHKPPGERRIAPVPGGYYDQAYTRTLSGLQSKTEAKLRELEKLKALHKAAEAHDNAPHNTHVMLAADEWVRDQAGTVTGMGRSSPTAFTQAL